MFLYKKDVRSGYIICTENVTFCCMASQLLWDPLLIALSKLNFSLILLEKNLGIDKNLGLCKHLIT